MFGLFRQWFRRRAERDRMIFRFWDGRRFRSIDPIHVYMALETDEAFIPARHLPLVDSGDSEGISVTCAAVRRVFGVQGYDAITGRGLTLGEQLGLLNEFYWFIDQQKKSGEPSRTSPPSSDATAGSSGGATTSATSASGPTDTESSPVAPTPSGAA